MEQKATPKYYGLRIYISSVLLYFFLAIPFLGFIAYQNVPAFIKRNPSLQISQAMAIRDSIKTTLDTTLVISDEEIDSLVNMAIQMSGKFSDSIPPPSGNIVIGTPAPGEEHNKFFKEKGPFARYFRLLFLLLIVSYVAGYIYNRPFKRYFRLKRRKKEIREKLHVWCKKQLFHTPLINSLIVTMPNIVVIIYSIIFLVSEVSVEAEVERSMFLQLHYLTLVATALEFLFIYYWQKHRVHIRYIDQIYSDEELRK
ncbi:MAG: hypothetical protein K8R52_05670, partial [Bacteroidales bacterium]|nr:hypothetical protein [Bacteroidales bacterium]